MSNAPQFVLQNFQLAQHELLSGEAIFLVPYTKAGQVCAVDSAECTDVKAYVYNPVPKHDGVIHPCGFQEWDDHALCLSEGRLGRALFAFGCPAELTQSNGVGYFSRFPVHDLHWELNDDGFQPTNV